MGTVEGSEYPECTHLSSSSVTNKISSTKVLICWYAFSPANGGAKPPAILLASGHWTAVLAWNAN